MQKIGDQEIRWPIAVLLIIIGATYFTGLDNEFVFDDLSVLKNNICLGDLSTLKHLFTWDYFATFSEYTYRPLGSFTYWFDAWIWGHRSFGYHVTNLILHLATVAALFGLVHALGGNFRSAFLTATVFGLNPVFSEAVYCSGFREDLLVALTSILVLTVVVSSSRHLSGRRRVGLAGWLFVLALFSKESAAAIPPVCLIT
ncbi:MAG: hypothetical protein QGH40_05330, partial [bacterium]|nr:hypothetical protein [bacterium]